MIVISLALVIAAAVSLFIGLFVVTDTLTFIFLAIGLCLLSLLLLWLGTRTRKVAAPTSPSAPVYGSGARAGGSAAPARATADDELDDLTSPEGATVVRKTTARDRAAARVATPGTGDDATPPAPPADETPAPVADAVAGAGTAAATADTTTPTPGTAPVKKATKKAAAKKAVKKAPAKKATAKKATKKAAAKKATKKATRTTGAKARARLAEIPGVGPAKQDALLAHYGSLEAIRDASVDDIVANVKGFGEALASRVRDELS